MENYVSSVSDSVNHEEKKSICMFPTPGEVGIRIMCQLLLDLEVDGNEVFHFLMRKTSMKLS